MKILDGLNAIATIVKQYNDLELNQQIINLTQQALELVNENARLTAENEELKKTKDIQDRVNRHEQPFITLDGENINIRYCSTCWGKTQKLIQVRCCDNGSFRCPECNTRGTYDKSKIANSSWISY